MPHIDHITEKDIRHIAGRVYAGRGDIYQREGRIHDCRQTERQLFGYCKGSGQATYETRIPLRQGQIAGARCTCPVGGWCKHAAALLFEWVRNPEAFARAGMIREKLEACSRDDLIDIIDRMLDRRPELSEFAELWASTAQPASPAEAYREHVDRSEIRRRARQVLSEFSGAPWDRGESVRLGDALGVLLEFGDRYGQSGRLADAAAIYAALLQALRDHYDDYDDESGRLRELLLITTGRLTAVFSQMTDPYPRSRVLPDLWDTWLFDNYFGGLGLIKPIEEALSKTLSEDEKQALLESLTEIIDDLDETDVDAEWERRQALSFALSLEESHLFPEKYLELRRQIGDLDQLVPALLDAGLVDEAVDHIVKAPGPNKVPFADLLVEYGHPSRAIEAMEAVAEARSQFPYGQRPHSRWLADFFIENHQYEQALPHALTVFEARHRASNFLEVRDLAKRVGRWEEMAQALTEQLLQEVPEELIKVYLHDGDDRRAIEIWDDIAPTLANTSPTALLIAEALRITYPSRAVDLFARAADELIERRGRTNYRTACQYLLEIRDVYYNTGHRHKWVELAIWLLDEYSNLPAFRDEMDKAGLLPDEGMGKEAPRQF